MKCKVSPLLAKLLLLDNICELHPLGGDACIRECPYSVRGILTCISEVWNKVEYLEMHEAKLELTEGTVITPKLQGRLLCEAWRDGFFCCCLDR